MENVMTKTKRQGSKVVLAFLLTVAFAVCAAISIVLPPKAASADVTSEVTSVKEIFVTSPPASSPWSAVQIDLSGGTSPMPMPTPLSGPTAETFTYYTTQQEAGFKFGDPVAGAGAFSPTLTSLLANRPDTKGGTVLKNSATALTGFAYTAPEAGTVYYQDLAQVEVLNYDTTSFVGGAYVIAHLSGSTLTQLYPAPATPSDSFFAALPFDFSKTHELLAVSGNDDDYDNKRPLSSAWVNGSVAMTAGDSLIFLSVKPDTKIFSEPVVSYEEFPETYEFHNFWRYQQINDANYFEPVYRYGDDTAPWRTFYALDRNGDGADRNFDIAQRGGTRIRGATYWTYGSDIYQYMAVSGGLWLHASGNANEGDAAYRFKAPHSGFVKIELEGVGEWRSDVQIVYNGNVIASATGDAVHKGGGSTANASTPVAPVATVPILNVSAGDYIYFVQKSAGGGTLKQDLNPKITYLDAIPYIFDATVMTVNEGATYSSPLTLTSNVGGDDLTTGDIEWTVSDNTIVEVTAVGTSAFPADADHIASVTVKGLKAGSATVTATRNGSAAVCTVTVAPIEKFTVTPGGPATVSAGATKEIQVAVPAEHSAAVSLTDIAIANSKPAILGAAYDGTTGKITLTGKIGAIIPMTATVTVSAPGVKSITIPVAVVSKQQGSSVTELFQPTPAAPSAWSVAKIEGGVETALTAPTSDTFTYYTTQTETGYFYKDGTDVSNKTFAYNGTVLSNGVGKMTAFVYTAPTAGTLYIQDLAQVAPLHKLDSADAGVKGGYRIVKISGGAQTQLFPASGTQKDLYSSANESSPAGSAWVNISVTVAVGDKIEFISTLSESQIYSSPVVSYEAFPEVYELHNFWRWQQINDSNYFEPVYKSGDSTTPWLQFPELETDAGDWDIVQRNDTRYNNAMYRAAAEYQFMGAFGGLFLHASGLAGEGDIAYRFKVPHNGYVSVEMDAYGSYLAVVQIVYKGNVIAEETDGDKIWNGATLTAPVFSVEEGDYIYFVQKSAGGGSLKQDLNPRIKYVSDPFTLSDSAKTIEDGETFSLTLDLNPDYGFDPADIVWTVTNGAILSKSVSADGATVTLTGLKGGATTVTATVGGTTWTPAVCAVTVNPVAKFAVTPVTVSVKAEETAEVTVSILAGFTLSLSDISVESDKTAVCTVAYDGATGKLTITGVAAGTASVYVTSDGVKSVIVTVTVTAKTGGDGEEPGGDGLSGGAIAGIVIGSAAVAGGGVFAAWWFLIRKKKKI
ncbi:hypothetical protein FACS1894211_13420 [Clostridia bacterium]|nr:hypothetical protein FACS1894211_13420 [Clostridia bacterium]